MNPPDKTERERQLDEAAAAYLKEIEAGRAPDPAEWLARYPELADFFAAQDQVGRLAAPLRLPDATLAPEEALAVPLGTVRYFGEYELLEEVAQRLAESWPRKRLKCGKMLKKLYGHGGKNYHA